MHQVSTTLHEYTTAIYHCEQYIVHTHISLSTKCKKVSDPLSSTLLRESTKYN